MLTDKNKDSFCPAKWQEISYNPSAGYVNACSKSLAFDPATLAAQRTNLLNGIKDPSCDYCWKVEAKGHLSLRHTKLKEWDGTLAVNTLDINIGNLCNLQCSYCGPRYSTVWETDIRKNNKYNILFDSDRLLLPDNAHKIKITELITFVNQMNPYGVITVLGGEPLINPDMCALLDELPLSGISLAVPTNLCYNNSTSIQKLAVIAETNNVILKPSLDTVNLNVKEYIRSGFSMTLFKCNVYWILNNTRINLEFLTLLTAHTVWGVKDTLAYVRDLAEKYPGRINWNVDYCYSPASQTFDILTDDEIIKATDLVESIVTENDERFDVVLGALDNSTYNRLARQDQQNFFKQFNERNGLATPEELKFLIEDEIL